MPIVMWQVRLLMRVARPLALGRNRRIVGPSSTVTRTTTSSRASRPWLWSALAMADWRVLRIGTAAARVL